MNNSLAAVWAEINCHIRSGDLPGNGLDQTAHRNGLVMAANIVFEHMNRLSETDEERMEQRLRQQVDALRKTGLIE